MKVWIQAKNDIEINVNFGYKQKMMLRLMLRLHNKNILRSCDYRITIVFFLKYKPYQTYSHIY